MIDPLRRIDLQAIEALIADQSYFVLHAPPQTGKTTCLLALMQHLNTQGDYRACYVNIEAAQTARDDVPRGLRTICGAIARAASQHLGEKGLRGWTEEAWAAEGPDGVLTGLLERWSQSSDRPIVLMLDEVDALVGDTLVALLTQIRAGHLQRPEAFPQTIMLCGVRDVHDYRVQGAHGEISTGATAFDVRTESLRIGNFSLKEAEDLWLQHLNETGQHADSAIWPELWEDTSGQPWLVNALARELTMAGKDRAPRDPGEPITLERYKAARERLIQSRTTHLEQLADRLHEERVRRIISDILDSEEVDESYPEEDLEYAEDLAYPAEDLQYVEDLGLIVTRPEVRIANRIYHEIIPRRLPLKVLGKLLTTSTGTVHTKRI